MKSPHPVNQPLERQAAVVDRQEACRSREWQTRPDEDLLAVYVDSKTREAFDELVRRYQRELSAYLRRYLKSQELAEDVFQETFLQVHLKCDQFDPRRKFRPWLYRIATNRAIDLIRRRECRNFHSLNAKTRHGRPLESIEDMDSLSLPDPGPAARLEAAEARQWIRSAARTFPPRLQGVLALVLFRGLKYQEAADALRIPLGSVKSRMHEAILRLKAMLPA